MSKHVISLILIIVIGLIAGLALLRGETIPPADKYIQGIDISHHQGRIDWDALYGDEIDFVFMKATEGGSFVDPRFAQNWKAAGRTQMLRGAYHFFTQCRSAEMQAAHYIKTVGDLTMSAPPILDLEHMGPCTEGPTMERPDQEIAKLMGLLEAEYGARPILYTTREFHDAYLVDFSADEMFWVRSILKPPQFRKKDWTFWQHHHRGKVRGIQGPVDLNAYRGSAVELENMRVRRNAGS